MQGFPERSPQEKKPTKKPTGKNAHKGKCPQGKMPTRKNAHREICPQGKMPTGKNAHRERCPTRNNAHMYNSFKIVTGMNAFVKNRAMRAAEGNITKSKDLG